MNEFNCVLLARRLYQQWIVDSYVKIEKDRIQWCKDNQKQIKADTYKGLHYYLQNSANDINGQVGRTIIPHLHLLDLPVTCNNAIKMLWL